MESKNSRNQHDQLRQYAFKKVEKELNRKYYISLITLIVGIYLAITCTIMRFSHPEYTETELFMAIPRALVWNFK